MKLRQRLPRPIRAAARRAYVAAGELTASHRPTPDFLLIGGQRCGTTSLFRALEQHPRVARPTLNKGVNYFDLNYHRGPRWYRAHFPTRAALARRAGGDARVFEASGYYLFHPLAPERIAADLPGVKIVAMLRDPVERAFSAWKHETARGFDTLGFEEALAREEERTSGERRRLRADPDHHSYAYRHYSYASRGDYAEQLREYYRRLPASDILVIYSEDFFARPDEEFARLCSFLGLPAPTGVIFDQHNARPSSPMPGGSRRWLTERYRDQARELEDLTGRTPPWPDLTRAGSGRD